MVGGTASTVGAIIIGPRIGRFEKGKVLPIPGHSTVLLVLGYFLLFFGFFAFNAGSENGIAGDIFHPDRIGRAAVVTALGASGGFITSLLIYKFGFGRTTYKLFTKELKFATIFGGYWCITGAVNGGLGGMVAICAGCFGYEPWAGFVVGCIAGATYCLGAHFWLLLHIDDPVNAGPLHLGCGWWGTLACGLFLHGDRYLPDHPSGGVLYGWDSDAFLFFGIQVIGAATIFAWVAVICTIYFLFMHAIGMLRVTEEEEDEGLDFRNGEPAYPIDPAILEAYLNESRSSAE